MNTLTITNTFDETDFAQVHAWLASDTVWARGIPMDLQRRAMGHSVNFFARQKNSVGSKVVGFARVVTDHATFAYLCDVYVPPSFRGQGVSRALMQAVKSHPVAQVRRIALITRTAAPLYRKFGFEEAGPVPTYMHIARTDPYVSA